MIILIYFLQFYTIIEVVVCYGIIFYPTFLSDAK